jgi:hypothetical protein
MKTIPNFNVKNIHVSDSLIHFKERIMNKFNLKECDLSSKESSFFFGMYTKNDVEKIESYKGRVLLIFGGSDLHMIRLLKRRDNIYLIFISQNLLDRYLYFAKVYNFKHIYTRIELNLVDTSIFKPIPGKLGKSIYIYDGFKNSDLKKRIIIYNIETINKVKKLLPQFNYINSSDNVVEYKDMPSIYKKCFIGLRLTLADGNANTVQEFQAMKIPIIHNQSDYGIKWKNEYDIASIINRYAKYFFLQ